MVGFSVMWLLGWVCGESRWVCGGFSFGFVIDSGGYMVLVVVLVCLFVFIFYFLWRIQWVCVGFVVLVVTVVVVVGGLGDCGGCFSCGSNCIVAVIVVQ